MKRANSYDLERGLKALSMTCESWTTKKAKCQRIDAFELWCWRRLESPLDFKEIKPVNPEGNQSWIFIGTDAEAEAPILWPPDSKSWLIRKDPDAGEVWRQEKGTTDEEMVGWHHRLNGHEFEQAPADFEGQGSLAWWGSWGPKELDMTEWLNKKSSLWLSILTVHFFLFAVPGRVPAGHCILGYLDLGFRVKFSKCVTLTWGLQVERGVIRLLIVMSTPFCKIQWQNCSIQLRYPSPCNLHLWFRITAISGSDNNTPYLCWSNGGNALLLLLTSGSVVVVPKL